MVLSKRKRKDNINVPITVQNDVEPKRTRVQAQRKYAQGQPVPTSVYLAYNSEQTTPVKENSNPPVDVLPNLNPSTEDFIKYLCFRNTSMCPKEFEFASSPSTSAGPSTSKNEESSKNTDKKSSSKQKIELEEEQKTSSNSGYIPFAVRKRAENNNDKKKPQAQNVNQNVKKKKVNPKGNKSNNGSEAKLNNSEVQLSDKSEENSAIEKEKSGRKRSRIKNSDSTNSLNTNPISKSQKLEPSFTNISDVKIVLEKTDVDKAIEINKTISNKKVNESKNAKDKNDKRTTRLSALRNTSTPTNTEIKKNNVDAPSYSKKEIEFSSDDEKPLMNSTAESKINSSKSVVDQKPSKESNKANDIIVPEKKIVTETLVSEPPKPKKRGRKKAEPVVQSPPISQLPVVEVKLDETTSPPKEKKKVGRKKKMTADAEIAELSQANTTDLSENEAKPGRPTRKTKEAATIYMELIGRKLTLNDFSDNDTSSLDSLELPNFKKMEQMENELKANANKNKSVGDKNKNTEDKAGPVLETPTPKTPSTKTKTENKKVVVTPEKIITESPETKKANKSFDDSDEEPLATKLGIEKKPPPKKRGRKSNKEKAEMQKLLDETLNSANLEKSVTNDTKLNETVDKNKSTPFSSKFQSPQTCNTNNEVINSNSNKKNTTQEIAKINQSSEKVSKPSNQLSENYFNRLSKVSDVTQNKSQKPEVLNDDDFVKGFESGATKPISLIPKSSINLLPSKEESEKIFGIASVTLAQSSGPLDTKCTLGKCGSIHKPPLGPAVLTESALGANLSPKDRRKSKVNMTREQIQKWLDETSWTPIPDELDEIDDLFDPKSQTKSSATTSKNNEVKETNVLQEPFPTPSTSKGPTLKAKAITVKKDSEVESSNKKSSANKNHQEQLDNKPNTSSNLTPTNMKQQPTVTENKPSSNVKSKSNESKINDEEKKPKTPTTPKSSLTNSDRKPIYNSQQRKKPVYKNVEQKSKMEGSLLNTFGAFSAENEHSVYSFDREDDEIPVTAPFRRCSRQESNNSKLEETPSKKEAFSMFQKPQNYVTGNITPNKNQVAQAQVSLTLSPEESKKSASISVTQSDNNVANEKLKESTVEKGENDSDSEGHTFYIPLQTTNVSGKNDQLIQGVAVKLGTEGAEGPNQKIIMHAKLVTKSRLGTNSAPLPESMSNVQEIVKTLMANNKDAASKPVPCATVQPRFKTNDLLENTNSESELMPSTSAMANSDKQPAKQSKKTYDEDIQPINTTVFPRRDDPALMVEAPVFKPTEQEFQDPIEYIERIAPFASRYGICKIIPPESFKPECRVSDEMRFTASNQYVHKMLHRWGPSAKEFSAIKKYLATQSIVFQHPPLIAGMEVDLPRLYHTVQELGGLKEVIEKKKWAKVAEDMCIPKSAHDRVTKLDDIYCKYLLPYDTLSHNERQKLFDEVEADWAKREARARRNADKGVESDDQSNEEEEDDSDEDDNSSMECMVKGRSMALSQFFRVARNTMALWFRNSEPTVVEIENEYWRHVAVRDSHVCVHYGSIDSSCYGFGFPMPGPKMKSSPCSKHPWNLKVLTNNNKSIIRSLGPVMGVTVPTLHVGMLFSAVCWYRDPHGLPWIEYLHTGANKIWYAVPDEQSSNFRTALTSLVPSLCQNKTIWLPCDTAMVPPYMLTDRNVSLCRTEQEPGQFVVVFPRAYTSSLCTGYTVSESVYFATSSWLDTAHEDFKDITESCEPAMFSLEQLMFAIANDQRTPVDTLTQILPILSEVFEKEKKERQQLKDAGVTSTEKVHESKNKAMIDELECNTCRANLYISWIKLVDEEDETIYCPKHALKYLSENRIQANQCRLMYTYSVDDIKIMLNKLNNKISSQIQTPELSTTNQSENQGKKKGNAKIKHGIATLIK